MKTLRKAFGFCGLLLLLFTTACGGAAAPATQVYSDDYDYGGAAATEAPAAPDVPLYEEPAYAPDQNREAPTAEPPDDMFFDDTGVNPLIDADEDNLSTFALDVDTGSYTIMRNYLSGGNLPPADS